MLFIIKNRSLAETNHLNDINKKNNYYSFCGHKISILTKY